MKASKFILALCILILKTSSLVKARNVIIESTDSSDNTRLLRRKRNRADENYNNLERDFSQIYFGKSLRKLRMNKTVEYETVMSNIAQNLLPDNVSVECKWITQGDRRERVDRKEKRMKIYKQRSGEDLDDDFLHRDLKECSPEKTASLTIKFFCTWKSASDNNLEQYFKDYVNYMNSREGRLKTASQLRDIDVCAITAKNLKVIHTVAPITYSTFGPSRRFQQLYTGYGLAHLYPLNSGQIIAYEKYFEELAKESTLESATITCTYITENNWFRGLNVFKNVGYEMIWSLNNEGSEGLIDDYLNYINDSEKRNEIKIFMKSIGVIPVDNVDLVKRWG